MKNKMYNIILVILIISLFIVIAFIMIKYGKNQVKEKELENAVEEVKINFNTIDEEDIAEIDVKYKGYNIVGIIKIPSIDIEYPIINKTDEQTMKTSITKFWGNNINDIGNFTMTGHNYIDGTMFGKIKELKVEDIIEMTDLTGRTIEYKIFDKYVTNPNDIECINSIQENTREITLITCTNGRSNRLIIKAREAI